jgi:hypothetical protein
VSEPGEAQTDAVAQAAADAASGLLAIETGQQASHRVRNQSFSRTLLEGATGAGESPVGDARLARRWTESTAEHVEFRRKQGRPLSKAKYSR